MTTHSKSARYPVSPEKLYAFISNIENLPNWATSFCSDIRKDGDDYKITNPAGEMTIRYDLDPARGIIDMYAGPSKDMMWCWPTRITSDNTGGSVFSFTCVQMPDQPDDAFAAQLGELEKELENIRVQVAA